MAKDDHLDLGSAAKAKLARDSKYRDNGHDHIRGSGRKNRYAGPYIPTIRNALLRRKTKPRAGDCEPAGEEHAQRYTFTYKKNFKLGISPYPNQAHHLLPEQAFGEKILGRKERYLLSKIEYNINDGDNIVFLPVYERDTDFHLLPYHGGSHPQYTNLVITDMRQVKQSLQREIAKDPDHQKWNPPSDVKNKLETLESRYWKYLTKAFPEPLSVAAFRKPKPGGPSAPAKRSLGRSR